MGSQTRISNPDSFELEYIDSELLEGHDVIIQFSDRTYNNKLLAELNELCGKYDRNFEVRFYGHDFDFTTLLKIPHVKSLYVDGINKADNVKEIAKLQNLQKLSLGVYELEETELLALENFKSLTELWISDTKTKAFNLEYLKDYKKLKFLLISEHTKNIEAVGELINLEYLSFNAVKNTPVPFVNKLKNLKTLKFILGSRENIHEIGENEIENLAITWVRGFNDLSNISKFKKLKTLLIEDNIQLPAIEFDKELQHLNDLKILNCKSFNSLKGLEKLPALHHLRIHKTALDFEKLIKQKMPENLKIFAFYTGKKKTDDVIKATLEKKGYSEYSKK